MHLILTRSKLGENEMKSLLIGPNRVEQRRQAITTPGHSLARSLQSFTIVCRSRLGTVLNSVVSDVLRQRKAFIRPATEVERIIKFQIRVSGGIACRCLSCGRWNLTERRGPEICPRRRKGANAAIPITMEVGCLQLAVITGNLNRHQIASTISFGVGAVHSGSAVQWLMNVTDEVNDEPQRFSLFVLISARLENVYIVLEGFDYVVRLRQVGGHCGAIG